MSVAEIIEAVERLTPAERDQVQAALSRLSNASFEREILVSSGICTGGSGRLAPFTPLQIHLDPPLSETIIAERR